MNLIAHRMFGMYISGNSPKTNVFGEHIVVISDVPETVMYFSNKAHIMSLGRKGHKTEQII
jgi:hypothetical protein